MALWPYAPSSSSYFPFLSPPFLPSPPPPRHNTSQQMYAEKPSQQPQPSPRLRSESVNQAAAVVSVSCRRRRRCGSPSRTSRLSLLSRCAAALNRVQCECSRKSCCGTEEKGKGERRDRPTERVSEAIMRSFISSLLLNPNFGVVCCFCVFVCPLRIRLPPSGETQQIEFLCYSGVRGFPGGRSAEQARSPASAAEEEEEVTALPHAAQVREGGGRREGAQLPPPPTTTPASERRGGEAGGGGGDDRG